MKNIAYAFGIALFGMYAIEPLRSPPSEPRDPRTVVRVHLGPHYPAPVPTSMLWRLAHPGQ